MKHLASIVCLLLPLALVAAPARKTKAHAPTQANAPAQADAHPHRMQSAPFNPAPAAGTLSLPAPHQAVRQLRGSLSEPQNPRRRSLAHVNLGGQVQLRVLSAPYWTTTTPRAPRTFTIALLSLNW